MGRLSLTTREAHGRPIQRSQVVEPVVAAIGALAEAIRDTPKPADGANIAQALRQVSQAIADSQMQDLAPVLAPVLESVQQALASVAATAQMPRRITFRYNRQGQLVEATGTLVATPAEGDA